MSGEVAFLFVVVSKVLFLIECAEAQSLKNKQIVLLLKLIASKFILFNCLYPSPVMFECPKSMELVFIKWAFFVYLWRLDIESISICSMSFFIW